MNKKLSKPIESYKTAVFKIHNPSNRKKAILRDMLVKSHEAYSKTLNHWLPTDAEVQQVLQSKHVDKNDINAYQEQITVPYIMSRISRFPDIKQKLLNNIQKKKDTGKRIDFYGLSDEFIDKYIRTCCPILSGSATFGVCKDIIATIKSYIKLYTEQKDKSRSGKPGKPTVQLISKNRNDFIDYSIYEHFISSIDLQSENDLRDKTAMLRKQGKIRPVEIPKSDITSGFMLLHNPDTDKYYAYINTHTAKSRFKNPANITLNLTILSGVKKGQPIVPNKDGYTINSPTGILLPLAFGQEFQHAEFIAKGTAKTAKLVHVTERHGKAVDIYELHIAFKFIAEPVQTETYLGVDRGIYNLASITVIDKNGNVLDSENIDGKALRNIQKNKLKQTKTAQKKGKIIRDTTRKAMADENIHITVNQIIALAVKHKSQIILENLKGLTSHSPRPKGKRKNNFRKVFTRQQYSKLEQVLEYKQKLYGLPRIYEVSAWATSQQCPECGHIDPKNRDKTPMGDGFKMDIFKCVKCGYKTDADINASRNIALKGYFLKEVYKKKATVKFGEVFKDFLIEKNTKKSKNTKKQKDLFTDV